MAAQIVTKSGGLLHVVFWELLYLCHPLSVDVGGGHQEGQIVMEDEAIRLPGTSHVV